MKTKLLKLSLIFLLGMGLTQINAQKTITTAGGNATESVGNAKITIGQIAYNTIAQRHLTLKQRMESLRNLKVLNINHINTKQFKSNNAANVKKKLDYGISQYWDTNTNQWVNSQKFVYTYDSNGINTMEIDYNWNTTTNQWVNSQKSVYTIDANGNTTMAINQNWDTNTNQWVNSYKFIYTIDANGNTTADVNQNWDSTSNQWVTSYRDIYTIDANGNTTMTINQNWDTSTNQWVNSYKYEDSYNSLGEITTEIDYDWSSFSNKWNPTFKNVNSYNSFGNLTTQIVYSWDSTNKKWDNYSKFNYTIDANGDVTMVVNQNWNSSTNQWVNFAKNVYSHDSNGNPTKEVYYTWDSTNNVWQQESNTYDFTYNLSYVLADLILPPMYTFHPDFYYEIVNMPLDYIIHFNGLNSWKVTYNYANATLGIKDELLDNTLKLYPNPVSNTLTIDSKSKPVTKVEIYSVLGKKIKTIKSNFKVIKTENLATGIYLVKIYSEKGSVVKKLIKQ